MADSRFAVSGDDELQKLKEKGGNSNTKKSTQTWFNVLGFTLAVVRSSETTIKCYGRVSKSQTRPVDE